MANFSRASKSIPWTGPSVVIFRTAAILAVLVAGLSNSGLATAGGMTWWQFGGNEQHSGFTVAGPLPRSVAKLRSRWSLSWTGQISEPVVDNEGQIFVASKGKLIALNGRNGRREWVRQTSGTSVPAYTAGCGTRSCRAGLYVTNEKALEEIDPNSGKVLWSYRAAELSWPTAVGDFDNMTSESLFVTARGATLIRMRLTSPRPVWRHRLLGHGQCGLGTHAHLTSLLPSVNENSVYVIAANGCVYSVSAQSGRVSWDRKIAPPSYKRSVSLVSGNHLVVAAGQGGIRCLNSKTGDVQWKLMGRPTRHGPAGIAAAHGLLYLIGVRAQG